MSLPPLVATMLLAGCWTPPVATVQPKGPPRLIQKGILVESPMRAATVQSAEPRERTIVLQAAGEASSRIYRADRKISGLDRIIPGATVQVSFLEELTICVGATQAPTAKVLAVDPSYRLLTLQYPDGRNETLKVGLDVKLGLMQAGDDVTIQRLEVVALAVRKPWWR